MARKRKRIAPSGESLAELPTRQIVKEVSRCRKMVNGYVNHHRPRWDRRGKRAAKKVERAASKLPVLESELRRRHPDHHLVQGRG